MNDRTVEPIRVGKAILAGNKLTVDGAPYELRHCNDFAAFVQNTSAVVATALATVFSSDSGELVFADAGEGVFKVGGVEPWQQYSAAALGFPSDPALAKVICGFHAIRTLSPPTSGHSFHAHSDRQSERSDAGLHC